MNNVYSSRKLEDAYKIDIRFTCIVAMNTPDHNTINTFRSVELQDPLKAIFTQVVELLAAEGLLSIKEIYTDGTKIEANANRYSFVWGNAIKTNKENMANQLAAMWQYAQSIADKELQDTTPIDKEKVQAVVAKIDAAIKDKPVSKTFK
jgi:hypothetical protein